MGLQRAGAPAVLAADVDLDEGAHAGVPRDHNRWPRIAPPGHAGTDVGITLTPYRRASAFGEVLEDDYLIRRAKERRIVFGLGRDVGLLARAQAVAEFDQARDELNEVAGLAAVAGGDGQRAAQGTALHLLSERHDRGEDLSYLPAETLAALDAWERIASRFDTHGTEVFVVCDELKAAGTFDRLWSPRGWLTAPDGTRIGPDDRLIADLKSGRSAQYFGPKYKVQQTVYALGVPYTHEQGRLPWPGDDRVPVEAEVTPRQDWALIVHVPLESPDDAGLYWVDLIEGAELARDAIRLREVQRSKGLPPAELPTTGGPTQVDLAAMLRAAPDRAALDALYDAHATGWTSWLTAVARHRAEELAGVPA